MSKGVRLFYFPDCTPNSLNQYKIWIGRKTDYLNMACVAGLNIILAIIIINKMYEKGTKWVKSTSASDSSSGGSEDSAVFFFPGFLVALVFTRGARAGLLCFQKELLAWN